MSVSAETVLRKLLVRYADLTPIDAGLAPDAAAAADHRQEFVIVAGAACRPSAALADGSPRLADRTARLADRTARLVHGPAGHLHGPAPPDFDIAGLRHTRTAAARPHRYDGAEVLIAHLGRWLLVLGADGEGERLELAPGDVASIPPGAYRQVQTMDGAGFLLAVRGADCGQAPPWLPARFAVDPTADRTPIEGGYWIDAAGGVARLRETGPLRGHMSDLAAATAVLPAAPWSARLAAGATLASNPASPLAGAGVEEAGIIASRATGDGIQCGPIGGTWRHGFTLRRLTLQSAAYVPMHCRREPQVLFIQDGTLEVGCVDGAVMLGSGDTLTVPAGFVHSLRNTASRAAAAFVVHGSDDTAPPLFQS